MFFHPQQGTVLRMIGNEPSTPGLFSGDLFDVIDSRVPRNWVVVKNKHGMHGIYEFSPAAWLEDGFWEPLFDGDPSAVATFTEQQRLAKESIDQPSLIRGGQGAPSKTRRVVHSLPLCGHLFGLRMGP
jgi:hypothetical protein